MSEVLIPIGLFRTCISEREPCCPSAPWRGVERGRGANLPGSAWLCLIPGARLHARCHGPARLALVALAAPPPCVDLRAERTVRAGESCHHQSGMTAGRAGRATHFMCRTSARAASAGLCAPMAVRAVDLVGAAGGKIHKIHDTEMNRRDPVRLHGAAVRRHAPRWRWSAGCAAYSDFGGLLPAATAASCSARCRSARAIEGRLPAAQPRAAPQPAAYPSRRAVAIATPGLRLAPLAPQRRRRRQEQSRRHA